MIEKGLILTGNDADLLDRALSEVKIKVYEESEARLDGTQALDALVHASGLPRMMDRKKKDVTHILAACVSALC
jgi:hypothetical protein